MGCDIHVYLEFSLWEEEDGKTHWSGWPRINPGRDYSLFARIAGVRGDAPAIVEPRGVPDDMSYYAAGDFWITVDDKYAEQEHHCSAETAARYVGMGSTMAPTLPHAPDLQRVSNPDFHSHTWLTTDEFLRAMLLSATDSAPSAHVIAKLHADFNAATILRPPAEPGVEYWALLVAARTIEARGRKVRFVIWFDN